MRLPTTFALSYGVGFAAITATVMHTLLYHRRLIWMQAGRSVKEQAVACSRRCLCRRSAVCWRALRDAGRSGTRRRRSGTRACRLVRVPRWFADDAPLVARKDDGWERMLEGLALRWVECVVDEKRGKDMA